MTREVRLARIAGEVQRCTLCRLHENRSRAVPGEGPGHARILLLGEAPGAEEDASGRPFVGRAGLLLERALESAGLRREDVFITNVVKCRPPENRSPRGDEVRACHPYLLRQLGTLQPAVIVTLGGVSLRALFPHRPRVGEQRGRALTYEGTPVVATYHPAAIRFGRDRRGWLVEDLRRAQGMAEKS